ncbi:DinB family protein [Flavobacterium sp. Sr18]|uniref:DinB family protein n=1 Tax=Flavobacterium sp. Sr18 TaxID=935222 RepID=UPI0019CFE450|nr:DinB family protein [Flavobacterium sp. Sr18]
MLIETLKKLFNRDLNMLKFEIESYQNETNLWKIESNISNSAGNLCLHLIGNLNTYIGAQFGKTGYIRNRTLEFSLKDIPKTELLSKIEATRIAVNNALNGISEEDLNTEYPLLVFENKTSTEFMFIHLTTHLAYHLGQINYHRRLLDTKI